MVLPTFHFLVLAFWLAFANCTLKDLLLAAICCPSTVLHSAELGARGFFWRELSKQAKRNFGG